MTIIKGKEFIEKLFWIQNQLQLSHWREPISGFRHATLGTYYKTMNEFIDTLVETYGGVVGKDSIALGESLYAVKNDVSITEVINDILTVLTDFRVSFESVPALVNIIDDMMTETYKSKYLLEFN